jgi:hypothetical protein
MGITAGNESGAPVIDTRYDQVQMVACERREGVGKP